MKKLFILFLLAGVFCFCQTAKIHYNFYRNNTIPKDKLEQFKKEHSSISSIILDKVVSVFNSESKSNKEYIHELIINNGVSYFKFINPNPLDDSFSITKTIAMSIDQEITDLKTGLIIRHHTYGGNEFLINSNNKDFNWKITDESKKIGKYTCYKAIGVRKVAKLDTIMDQEVEAWFTPEIPFSAGPGIYSGLPGLIVSLRDNINFFTLKDIEIGGQVDEIKPFTTGEKITNDDYQKYVLEGKKSRLSK